MAKKKNPNAVALGSLGGKARAEALTAEERSEISRQGSLARNKNMSAAERRRIAMIAVQARERKRKQRKEAK